MNMVRENMRLIAECSKRLAASSYLAVKGRRRHSHR